MDRVLKKTKIFLIAVLAISFISFIGCGDDDSGKSKAGYADPDYGSSKVPAMTWPDGVTAADQWYDAKFAGRYRDVVNQTDHPGCMPQDNYDDNKTTDFLVASNTANDISNDGVTYPPNGTDNMQAYGISVSNANSFLYGHYQCAGKEYTHAGDGTAATNDATKPIVLLFHGNSSAPMTWEEYYSSDTAGVDLTSATKVAFKGDSTVREQLASKLVKGGYLTIAFDVRADRIKGLKDYDDTNTYLTHASLSNPYGGTDLGYYTPLAMNFIKGVIAAKAAAGQTSRKIVLVGHSLGGVAVRDAIRRLYIEYSEGLKYNGSTSKYDVNIFDHVSKVVVASSPNHGVGLYEAICKDDNASTRRMLFCQLGNRDAYSPEPIGKALNGPTDKEYLTPCSDGKTAYGKTDATICNGNTVQWMTITIKDIDNASFQDEFVSEYSASLGDGATNVLLKLTSIDYTGYFLDGAPGVFATHMGSIRHEEGMNTILSFLIAD